MRRAVALAAALSLLAALPAEAKPLRFADKRAACSAKKKRPACRGKATRSRGWRARAPLAAPLAPPPALVPAGGAAPEEAPAAPAAEQPGASPPPDGGAATPPAAPLCDPSPWLGVTAEDVDGFRLRVSRTCVPEGTVFFQFRNDDLAEHNLWAEGTDPVRADREVVPGTPGETIVTAEAELAAGEWRLYCSFDGHEAMSRLVDVTPAG